MGKLVSGSISRAEIFPKGDFRGDDDAKAVRIYEG